MSRSRTRMLLLATTVLVLLAMLVGCGGQASPSAAPAAATSAPATATKAATTSAPSAATSAATTAATSAAAPASGSTAQTIVPVKAGPKLSAPVKLGFVSSLTGAVSDASIANKRGFEQAIKDFNAAGGFGGEPVVGVAYDDEAKPDKAVELTTRLISSDKVVGVIGYNAGGCALAAIDVTQKAKIPFMGTGSGVGQVVNRYANEAQNYQFGVRHLDAPQAQLAISFMRDKRGVQPSEFGTTHDASGYGADSSKELISELSKLGVSKVCSDEIIQAGTVDATPQIQKLQANGCKAVMNYNTGTDRSNFFKKVKQIGAKFQILLDWGGSQPSLYKLVGKDAFDGIIFTQAFSLDHSPEAKALGERLNKEYGELGYPLVTAQGYDGTMLMLRAISDAGSTDGTKIAEALEKISGFKGTTTVDAAPFTHTDHEGLDKMSQFFMATWKDGQVVQIDK